MVCQLKETPGDICGSKNYLWLTLKVWQICRQNISSLKSPLFCSDVLLITSLAILPMACEADSNLLSLWLENLTKTLAERISKSEDIRSFSRRTRKSFEKSNALNSSLVGYHWLAGFKKKYLVTMTTFSKTDAKHQGIGPATRVNPPSRKTSTSWSPFFVTKKASKTESYGLPKWK